MLTAEGSLSSRKDTWRGVGGTPPALGAAVTCGVQHSGRHASRGADRGAVARGCRRRRLGRDRRAHGDPSPAAGLAFHTSSAVHSKMPEQEATSLSISFVHL